MAEISEFPKGNSDNISEVEKPLDVSIVIPTYGRPAALANCLSAIAEQKFPTDRFEVIVVDDGSPIPASEVVDLFNGQFQLTVLRQDNAGPATARNTGAARARGSLLVFTDDDCTPHPQWLGQIVARSKGSPDAAIGGKTVNALEDNVFSAASQILVDYLYDYFSRPSTSSRLMFTSNNLAIPAAPFREIGGFPEGFPLAAAEDRDLCDRWTREGRSMIYEPDAVIEHRHSLGLISYIIQHFNYGCGAHLFQRLRRARGDDNRIEPFRFYRGLVLYPFGKTALGRACSISSLLCLAQIANATGFIWQKWVGR